ncbi:MAG: D-glycero-beta-D-manno-heptose-7-phosphate kinase [Candidatus Omnitrophica bacterium CG02_land_8_20_14_3_00__42_8]|nr:MAG: D-glycero-beta-D-manno-heptose-7-phosphate kinase [Candidatus Omnitrophica bacterium CG02_land_8_20_14_3_00__42_8]PIW68600.1 MAG: D-glycero-beta-D-manno-heptose-7-phosphate kinase [Candidatus Omnitrophica bacterium CG12_big_fil_rev_8_21_14_0_65_42_8]
MNTAKLKKIIPRFKDAKILVIGDLILDEFVWGDVSRISPEAPVPVVWVKSESFMSGGAANVANNITSLGARAYIAGVVGNDERGGILKEGLEEKGINIDGVIADDSRPTTLKTRVVAHHQQVVRIDREKVEGISAGILDKIIFYIKDIIDEMDAIVIEDYGKGVISARLLKKILTIAKKKKKIITVDPKEEHFSYYNGVTAITPNHHEAAQAVGMKIKDNESILKIGRVLLKKLKCEGVLVTLGENGMQLFQKSGAITHIPTVAQEVYDVSGAGDTVISVFTLALALGINMKDAAYISNIAAGIVVGKVGIAVITQEELLARIKGKGRE